jgi:penicillin-binding protein A
MTLTPHIVKNNGVTRYEFARVSENLGDLPGVDVTTPGTSFYDEKLKIKDTPLKGSYKGFGNISDLTALQVSSNVYMFKTAIEIGGGHYVPNDSLNINTEDAFSKLRNSYASFGLGSRTGIDLLNESAGLEGL